MVFLDGVGIGRRDAVRNPFFASHLATFERLLGGRLPHLHDAHRSSGRASLRPINATLGVRGLPQSGTGQTALLTGVNAPKIIGKHFGPYPYSTLKPILRENNLFRKLDDGGRSVLYANAFPRQFFDHISSTKNRMTALTMSWLMSGFRLNTAEVLAQGRALSADITNERWPELGYPAMPVLTPQEAGKRLVELTLQNDFVLYEYYHTDLVGHGQSMEDAVLVLERLDRLLEGIDASFDAASMLLIVTSDHGNLEDLSTRSHTRNPVPLLVVGRHHREIIHGVKDLTHVAPAILNLLH